MGRSRFGEEQIIAILKEQEAGMATADMCAVAGSARRRSTSGNRNRVAWRCPRLSTCVLAWRPPVQAMIAFIDDHRNAYGVEPICRSPHPSITSASRSNRWMGRLSARAAGYVRNRARVRRELRDLPCSQGLAADNAGFVHVAFVIDTYARRIVGWWASRTAHASWTPRRTQ